MNLSSQEPIEVQISKLKFRLYRKNQKCILVIALDPKILQMRFLTAQLNRTLIKNIINMNDTQKCTKYQEIWLFKSNFRTEWVKSPLYREWNLLEHVSIQNVLYEKLWRLDPLYIKNLLNLYNIFRMIKKSSMSL